MVNNEVEIIRYDLISPPPLKNNQKQRQNDGLFPLSPPTIREFKMVKDFISHLFLPPFPPFTSLPPQDSHRHEEGKEHNLFSESCSVLFPQLILVLYYRRVHMQYSQFYFCSTPRTSSLARIGVKHLHLLSWGQNKKNTIYKDNRRAMNCVEIKITWHSFPIDTFPAFIPILRANS